MSINAILGNAVSGLQTSQAALRTTSQNVANINSTGYVRREVQQQSINLAGLDVGVGIAEIRRMAALFLSREVLSAGSEAGTYSAMSEVHDRIQGLLGSPDSEGALPQRLSAALAGASGLTLDPASAPRRMGYISELTTALRALGDLANHVLAVRAETDQSVALGVDQANALIREVHDLNTRIAQSRARGEEESTLYDRREEALRELSDLVGIRTHTQENGAIHVETTTGFSLVSGTYMELEYQPTTYAGADIVYDPILAYRVNLSTGERVGAGLPLDEQLASGRIKGLLQMRDAELPNLAVELGQLAAAVADQLNEVHNNSVSFPAPNTLEGRATGLLSGDGLNFTGTTTLAVVDDTGALVRRVDIDFTAGTYSVNGGGSVALGATIGAATTALNTALGVDGTVSFSGGALTIDATNPNHGIGFLEPDTGGSSRGGRSFSQFFALNDLVSAKRPSHFSTGLTAADAQGFGAGEEIEFVVRGPNGERAAEITFAMPAGATIGDVVTALNNTTTGVGTYMTFALDSAGRMSVTPTPAYSGYVLDVKGDESLRAGQSFTEIFGIGSRYLMEQAHDLAVVDDIATSPDRLALAHLDIDGTTVVGDVVLTRADNHGALDLVSVASDRHAFDAVGGLGSTLATIGNYASLVVARTSNEALASDRLASASTNIKDEVETRRQNIEGVNLDEELAQMIVYQQAYNAAARLVTVAKEVYDQLINII